MGAADDVSSRRLESLSVRPPTPPRETCPEPDAALKQRSAANRLHPFDPDSSLQTPPKTHSPLLCTSKNSRNSRNSSAGHSRLKKVEFSTQAEYKEPPVYDENTGAVSSPAASQSTPPVLSSSSTPRPTKSILKVAACNSLPPTAPVHIADMLASAVQQLAGADRESKLDAYMILSRALKASDNLPDRIALQSKMSLFTQFIQRDITAPKLPPEGTGAGSVDAALAVSALDLLNTFLRFPAIASTLSSDFGIFIVDHCIRVFELQVTVPRDVLRSLMRVVVLQHFPAKVMTSDRVGRLVAALHNVPEQLENKQFVLMRALIYRQLVKDHRHLMLVHLDWLPDLFTDMLSSVPYVRDASVGLGLDAAFSLGRERAASQRVMDLFQTAVDAEKYYEYYAGRLHGMMKNKSDSPLVPRVWSVVTLFFRNIDRWDYFMPWVRILQDCFNTSDYRTREEANFAWSRFSYLLLGEGPALPSARNIQLLTIGLVSQLRRRGNGKQMEDLRRVALGSAGNLLYYALPPNTKAKQLDLVWDNSVRPLVQQLLDQRADDSREKRKANQAAASAILTGLIQCTTARTWKKDRVAKNPLVQPEDLPCIDPKWVRLNGTRIFALVGTLLERSFVDLATPRSATQSLWHAVVGSVAAAAAKEVKVSMETALFVGHAFSLLLKVWTRGVGQGETKTETGNSNDLAASQFLGAVREFILTMVDSLGSLPFTEKRLVKGDGNAFVPVATPAQRLSKGRAPSQSPLHHLFSILSTLPPGVPDGEGFADFIETTFSPFFAAKSDKGRRNLALDMLQVTPLDALCPFGPWKAAAAHIAASLREQKPGGSMDGGSFGGGGSGSNGGDAGGHSPMGHDFREVVRVLERGLRSTPNLPWEQWQMLFCALCERVRAEAGEAGLAMCVLEPLAKVLVDLRLAAAPSVSALSATATRAAIELLAMATQPRDRQAVDAARRRLWGAAIAASAPSSPSDPFDNLYRLVNGLLQRWYGEWECWAADAQLVEQAASLLNELAGFFAARCYPQLFFKALGAVQEGLACWIRDDGAKLASPSAASMATSRVWEGLCAQVERMSSSDEWTGGSSSRLPMAALEPLLCAALTSKHRHIVNGTLVMWSRLFGGHVGEMDYPPQLQACLVALQPFVDMAIPGLDATASVGGSNGARQPVFIDSHEADGRDADMGVFITLSSGPSLDERPVVATTPPRPAEPSSWEAQSVALVLSGQRASPAAAAKAPRLRHDDSQIEFTTVESVTGPGLRDKDHGHRNDGAPGDEESQVLTERQQEVRERQRETEALYSDLIMSSSPVLGATKGKAWLAPAPAAAEARTEEAAEDEQEGVADVGMDTTSSPPRLPLAQHDEEVHLPQQRPPVSTTPQRRHGKVVGYTTGSAAAEEDFIASTPTPRRGESLALPGVHDNDPPSSPPEPRRYPLMPEISSRSRSSSILDEWQFSSSPLSGSPIVARHTAPEPELSSLDGGGAGEEAPELSSLDGQGAGEEAPELSSLDGQGAGEEAPEPEEQPLSLELVVELSPMKREESQPLSPKDPQQQPPWTPMRRDRRRTSASVHKTPQKSQTSGHGTMVSSDSVSSSPQTRLLTRTQRHRQDQEDAQKERQQQQSTRVTRRMVKSSPVCKSGGQQQQEAKHSRPRTQPHDSFSSTRSRRSTQEASFFISDGDERSMLRLANELEGQRPQSSLAQLEGRSQSSLAQLEGRSQSSLAELEGRLQSSSSAKRHGSLSSDDSFGDSFAGDMDDDEDAVLDCITVWTDSFDDAEEGRGRGGRKKRKLAEVEEADPSATASVARWGRRYRYQRQEKEEQSDVSATAGSFAGPGAVHEEADLLVVDETLSASQGHLSVVDETLSASQGLDVDMDVDAAAASDNLSDVSVSSFDEELVHSQLALEQQVHSARARLSSASTGHEAAVATTAEQPAQKPKLDSILSMLRGSLELLTTATLSREEVHAIEDVCMDVKRALYDAERRGRQ